MRGRCYGYRECLSRFGMSPKKGKSSKKGRKVSKAERARQQEEEEKRRLREEEEARLQAEREEQERLERERAEQELERLELKDRERREVELNELRHLLEENHNAATQWRADAAEKAKWDTYMRCDGNPDPAVQREMNTFISLWRDDPEVDITPVLQQCNVALRLVEELEVLLRDATDPEEAHKYQEVLENLQEIIHSKHLLAAEEILKWANDNTDIETGNMQSVVRDDNVTLCLWANLRKNPRFKEFSFEEVGLGFELPRQLAVSDVAVRILHTHYDHLTLLARMAHLKIHTPSHRSLSGGDELPADVDEEAKEVQPGGEDDEEEEVRSIRGSEGRKSAASVQWREGSPPPAGGERSHIQTQMEALAAEGVLTPPSAPLATMEGSEQVRAVDLMQYTPLGGVFYYDVFHLPPQAHSVKGWKIRQVLTTGLQVFPYPTEKTNSDDEALACPSVGVSITLPDSVLFLQTPQVARWDAEGRRWRTDGIADVSYEEEAARISFRAGSFHAFALMQETYANFPFQSWELRPLGRDSAVYAVNGALVALSITIQGDRCMLQAERDRGLSHLLGRWMSGPALQRAMLSAGVNIFVNERSHEYVSTCGKDPLTEHAAYEQMAVAASACAFSWSRWNAERGAEHLVLQACEHHGPGPVPRDSWSVYLLGAQRCQRLEVTERSQAFSADLHPGTEFHSTFLHMLQDHMSAAGVARTRESSYLFTHTVQNLLCASRPLVYS